MRWRSLTVLSYTVCTKGDQLSIAFVSHCKHSKIIVFLFVRMSSLSASLSWLLLLGRICHISHLDDGDFALEENVLVDDVSDPSPRGRCRIVVGLVVVNSD